MGYKSNLDFITDFCSTNTFVLVDNELYMMKDNSVVPFKSDEMEQYVITEYQSYMNRIAPSTRLLLDNIKPLATNSVVRKFERSSNRIASSKD